mmetsp:Transcript_12977/g.26282  ORF Transcript_12977/g.26282 Transcript_12977/m.26282 type:complete len:1043 (-) Transcript_12977:117-3245(-)
MPRESNRSNKGKHSRYADEEEDTVGPNKHAKHCARVDSALTITDDAAANNKSAAAPTQDVAVPPIETNIDGSSTNAADESAALITTTLALNPSHNTLAHNRPTNINNNNNEPESTAAALSAVVDEEVDVRVPLPAAAAAAGDGDVDTPGDTNAVVVPLPQETVPSYDPKQLDEMFRAEFFIGRWFDSSEEAVLEVKKWQRRHYCNFRKEGRGAKCSNSSNTNSRKKASGEKTMTTKPFALSCSCPARVRWSNKKTDNGRVQITDVNGLHNHPCDLPRAATTQRLSGRNIKSVLPNLGVAFAPYLEGGQKPNTTTARKIVKAHLGTGVELNCKSLATITTAVGKYVNSDDFEGIPPIDSASMLAQFRAYTTNDAATENCSDILKTVLTNSSGETSWTVLQFMESLKKNDPEEFNYRIHKDSLGNIDAVCWQTGVHRAAFQLYGDALFLDARKRDTMNVLGMRYMTLVVIDANNKFWPISHSFVFDEDHTLYEFACRSTLEMTPGRTKESIKLGFGDLFFEPHRVKEWFPNILMMIDAYHLIHARNNQSILAKEFGPVVWSDLKIHFVNALEANTEVEFLKHIDHALAVAGSDQVVKDKIVAWQKEGHRWGHYSRNTVMSHRFISTSNYAEQNHWSIKANAPDDPNRTLEQNIADIIVRDQTLFDGRQADKFRWWAVRGAQMSAMPTQRANHLSAARESLDQKPYAFFVSEYELSAQYQVRDGEHDGRAGSFVRHISQPESEGRFIPDGGSCNLCEESRAMSMCRHDIAKRKHKNTSIFDRGSVYHVHLFRPITPRAKVDGTFVSSVARMTSEPASSVVDNDDVGDSIDLFGSNDGNSGDSKDCCEGVVDPKSSELFASNSNEIHGVLASPSKLLMPPIAENADGTSKTELRRSIPHNKFLQQGQDIAGLVVSLSTFEQHTVSSHLQNLHELLKDGDYSDARHNSTSVGGLATILAGIGAPERAAVAPNMPKARVVKRPGRKPEYRLGSDRSTVSGAKQRKCGFCKLQGTGNNDRHTSQNACPVKRGYGEFSRINSKGGGYYHT